MERTWQPMVFHEYVLLRSFMPVAQCIRACAKKLTDYAEHLWHLHMSMLHGWEHIIYLSVFTEVSSMHIQGIFQDFAQGGAHV